MKDEYICYRTQCRYHSGNVSGSDGSCNYFFITGETKTSLGEADITRKCGLYKPGTALRVRAQPVVLRGSSPRRELKPKTEDRRRIRAGRKYDWAQFRALWEEGKNDREIARTIGCNPNTVQKWRHGAGLPPVVLRGSSPRRELKPKTEDRRRIRAGRKYDWAQFRALWEEGKNDREIARTIGCNPNTVQKWRHGAGLPPRYRQEIDRVRLKELWEAGMDDPQIAARLGASRQSVQKARIALGLPTHNPRMSHGKVKK